MSQQATVLFDAPGPNARRRNLIIGAVVTVLLLGCLAAYVYGMRAQYTPEKFAVFGDPITWQAAVLPGLVNTLQAAVISVALAIVIGTLLGLGRLSDFVVLRGICGAIVEFFRAVPVLIMMIFTWELIILVLKPAGILDLPGAVISLVAVITGLTLYNGSVIAELIRSGVHSLPRGQREAGLAIGLTGDQTRWLVLLPQAITAMMPSLVSQLVVVLKDTALGSIVLYPELLRSFSTIASNNGNTIAALTLCAVVFIVINFALSQLAGQVQRRLAKRGARRAPAVGVGQVQTMR